jgi:hypothetical protein
MVLTADKTRKPILKKAMNKYLVNWSIQINGNDLDQISKRPEVLKKGLDYVLCSSKQNKLQIFRVAEISEITSFTSRKPESTRSSVRPHGIAILEAPSIEHAKKVVNSLVEGFSYGFGEVSVKNYLEYDIKPLMDLTSLGGQ